MVRIPIRLGLALTAALVVVPAGVARGGDAATAPVGQRLGGAPAVQARYQADYRAVLDPESGLAHVRWRLTGNEGYVGRISLRVDPDRYHNLEGDGTIRAQDGWIHWEPSRGRAELRYDVQLDHRRAADKGFDARMTPEWALFKGEDLFPPTRTLETVPGAEADARFTLEMPDDWSLVATRRGVGRQSVEIEEEHRLLDRPTGWMIAGKLGVTREKIAGVWFVLANPAGQDFRRMDLLAWLQVTVPELSRVLGSLPPRFVIVGAEDPMWRGGLSAPDSLYLHADRPLVQRDGTSPVIHELVHAFMHARAGKGGDWIVEGLAEWYSLEIQRRAGLMSRRRFRKALERLEQRGRAAVDLEVASSNGDTTARAVGVLDRLDHQIREATRGRRSLDDVVQRFQVERRMITTARLREVSEEISGRDLGKFFAVNTAGTHRATGVTG